MSFGIKIEVWGDYAAFNRPEMKVERVSYDVMTASAARGLLEAIYWKPQMRWVVDRITVLAPIRFTHIRRNEIESTIPTGGAQGVGNALKTGRGQLGVDVNSIRQQRAGMILRDVRYVIEAHIELVESSSPTNENNVAKHLDIFNRRARKGQYFHHPYLGTREFTASFSLVETIGECPPELAGYHNLGYMLDDIDFIPDAKGKIVESSYGQRVTALPRFLNISMVDGVIDLNKLRHEQEIVR